MNLEAIRAKLSAKADSENKIHIEDAEIICINIYEKARRKSKERRKYEFRELGANENVGRTDKIRNKLSARIKDAGLGESIFVKASEYEHSSNFYPYIHNLIKPHSKVSAKYSHELVGWVLTKTAKIK